MYVIATHGPLVILSYKQERERERPDNEIRTRGEYKEDTRRRKFKRWRILASNLYRICAKLLSSAPLPPSTPSSLHPRSIKRDLRYEY